MVKKDKEEKARISTQESDMKEIITYISAASVLGIPLMFFAGVPAGVAGAAGTIIVYEYFRKRPKAFEEFKKDVKRKLSDVL